MNSMSTDVVVVVSPSQTPPPSSRDQSGRSGHTPGRTPAPYGQACISCAKAKCKCILVSNPAGSGSGSSSSSSSGSGQNGQYACERCVRLGRDCKPSNGVRKRGAAVSKHASNASASTRRGSNGMSAASRAANLEQKLEDLVAILKAQAGPTAAPPAPPASVSSQSGDGEPQHQKTLARAFKAQFGIPPSSQSHRDPTPTDAADRAISGGPSVVTPATSAVDNATCSTIESTPSPLPGRDQDISMSVAAAEDTLSFFRQHYLRFFPFVYIPPEMSAAQLQRDRPYLWLNICTLCCKSPTKQLALNQRARTELAHKMLVSCERSVDLLLGTLCHLGWTMHFFLCKPSLNAMMNMAMSIVSDLRLDKPSQEDNPKDMNCFKAPDFIRVIQSTVRTMEERRATLACYVFCSSGSAFLRCQSMRWTPHMEDSLKVLATNPECEGDRLLVCMVRIRRLMENVSQSQTSASDGDGHVKPTAGIYVKFFRQALQSIKEQIPESLKDNRILTSLVLSAEMIIADLPFSNCICWGQMPEWHPDYPNRNEANNMARRVDSSRLEALYASLQTSKAFFQHFLTFELSDLLSISFPMLLNFFRASQILYRLRLLDDPGWDRSIVSDSVDLLGAIDVIAERFARLATLYGYQTDTDAEGNEVQNFYAKCAKTFVATIPMWRGHFEQAEAPKTTSTDTTTVGNPGSSSSNSTGISAAAAAAHAGTHTSATANMGVDNGPGPGPVQQTAGTSLMGGGGLNTNFGVRVSYPSTSSFMLPEMFPMDFSLDDAWCNEMMSSWDAGIAGPSMTYTI